MAWRISSCEGVGFAATRAAADTIWPGVQKPHCTASVRTNACMSGWSLRPSMVVTSRPSTVCTSVMQESVGTPSSITVHAPQWPSPQATFVPVSPRSSRNTCASERPTRASTWYVSPLIRSSGRGRHRHDVGEVDEPEGGPDVRPHVLFVGFLRQRPPHVARSKQQLADLVQLLAMAVRPVVRRVQRKAEHADPVWLPRPEQRRRHREVLVDPSEAHRLREGLHTLWRRGLTRRLPGGDAACISGQDIPYLLVRQPAQTRRPQRGQQGGRLLPLA